MGKCLRTLMLLLALSSPATSLAASTMRYDTGMAKAKALIEAHNLPAAERHLELMLKSFPGNPELTGMLARLFFWQHKYDASLALYDRLLKRRPSATLADERRKVHVAKELAAIDGMQDQTAALQRLEKLHQAGAAPYESGFRLAVIYLRTGSPDKAIALADRLSTDYPGDLDLKIIAISARTKRARPEDLTAARALLTKALEQAPENRELLALQAGLYAREGDYEKALLWYDRALTAKNDPAVAAARQHTALTLELQSCDRLIEQGQLAEAETGLRALFDSGSLRTAAGQRLARLHMRQGRHDKAVAVLDVLRKEQPDRADIEADYQEAYILAAGVDQVRSIVDRELLLQPADAGMWRFSGRLHLWDGDYSAAVKDLGRSLKLHSQPATGTELENAVLLQRLQGDQTLRLQLAANQPAELLRLQARYCFWKGRLEESLQLYLRLLAMRNSPDDRQEMAQIEAAAEAAEASTLPQPDTRDKDDGSRRNYLKITGEFTGYGKRLPNGKDFALELSQQYQTLTIAPSLANSSRFGKNDSQIGLGVSMPLRPDLGASVDFSVCPDAEFLPVWTVGGEIDTGIAPFEATAGYRHMAFRDSAVDLLVPGLTLYLQSGLTLDARLYLARSKGDFSLSIAPGIAYQFTPKWKTAYAITAGRSAESIDNGGRETVTRFTAISQRGQWEYRFSPILDLGMELAHTYRQGLYNTTGVSIYTRIRW